MDYDVLIRKAIEKNEVLQLLRGEIEYEVAVSKFTSDVFPTDVNAVLVNCFYKQKEKIEDIENIFITTFKQLLLGDASDVYIAVLYFDTCIFQEERNKATFVLNKKELVNRIKSALALNENKLHESVMFSNGMTKQNPWKNIENFNKYYCKKYKIDILP